VTSDDLEMSLFCGAATTQFGFSDDDGFIETSNYEECGNKENDKNRDGDANCAARLSGGWTR